MHASVSAAAPRRSPVAPASASLGCAVALTEKMGSAVGDRLKRLAKGLQVLAAREWGATPSYQRCHNLARTAGPHVPGQTDEEAAVVLFGQVKDKLRPKGRPEQKEAKK